MRFMTLWRPTKILPPDQRRYAEMNKFIEEHAKAGKLFLAGGWDPTTPCTVVKRSGDKVTVTDGPFAEAKEMVGGFAVLDVQSKEEVLEIARRFVALAGEGTSEIRELPTESA